MITKEKLIESIKSMPEDAFEDMDILLDRIILLDKIETGIKDIKDGNIISNEEMKSVIDSWFKK
jgi:predicted transcriptional regulator